MPGWVIILQSTRAADVKTYKPGKVEQMLGGKQVQQPERSHAGVVTAT